MSSPETPAPPPNPPPPAPAYVRRTHSHFNNWISASGAVLAGGALFSFAFLVWMDFSQHEKNPYLGILTYLVAPMFLIAGLAMVLFGAWAQRRYALKHAGDRPDRWQIDFGDPRQRRFIWVFATAGVVFLVLSAFGSYQTYHYSESTLFCGEVCHKAMSPEFTTYKRGAHARVECVECHVGSGAQWFVKAKINGTHQLIAYTFDNYKRPIETPIKNLRPAQDTCEKCHWPEKFAGNIEQNVEHFLSDKQNTAYTARLLLHVNKSAPGSPLGGIHWHVSPNERVEYFAADEKRQDIPWMRVVNKQTGAARVFRTEKFTGEPPAGQIRVMDCMDCHNRPAHSFPTANDAIEKAMAAGTLPLSLPNLKRVAVAAMTETKIATEAEAPQKIADYLRAKYAGPEQAAAVATATAEVQRIFAATIFPERKADWRVYPNNIGHKDWPGCFRCHDDKHKTAAGETVRSSDCNSCHTIIAQGRGAELETLSAKGLKFAHPGGELDPELTCSDCHNGGIQK
jgi:nitrate/TMAO reductase-like tetraheme cytochrome c subunit